MTKLRFQIVLNSVYKFVWLINCNALYDQESSLATELGQLFYKMSAPTPIGNKPVCSEQFDTMFHLQLDATALHLTDTDELSLAQASNSTPTNTEGIFWHAKY